METEIWKKHPEIEKLEVSSFGRVRSVKGHYYKSFPNNHGYMKVQFRMNGKRVNKLVHRLAAQTFIQNPNNWPEVNHKDNDRANNHVDNLEFCTHSYNNRYREKYGESQGHPVFAINLDTLEVLHFRSQSVAGRALGVRHGNIYSVINGNRKQAGGFWFVNDNDKATDAIKNKLHKICKGW